MELIERVEQLESELKALRPELHFPSTATVEHRLRWLEIVLEETRARNYHGVYAETPSEEKLRQLLAHTVYIKPDRITLHSLTADPGSVVAGDVWFRSDLGKGKLAVDAVVANAKLFPTVVGTSLKVSEVVRNANDEERTTYATEFTKKKEMRLNANLAVCRIKFTIRTSNPTFYVSGLIYKNGGYIGTTRSSTSTTGETFSQDFTGFVANDLIQIYICCPDYANNVYVSLMKLCYAEQIVSIGDKTLVTPLDDTTNPTISVTNQDP